ncbi:ThuA domain-containing protein [Portibacter lacus]|uniref:ThuA-like domain-containing protein n=1 Tax=Portibacter lacus TaxID=1099794 RepID=A0AA37SV24_9BACT|nr:ThuA domain-containing protein [Portibacter lacus]GLR18470.1 hypothetical protein GCM10007940_30860 [Portibacter lacus]
MFKSRSNRKKIVSSIKRFFIKAERTVWMICLIGFIPFLAQSQNISKKKVLIFSKTMDYRHESTEVSIEAIKTLCAQNDINTEATENSEWFNSQKLKEYDAILFLNSSGDVFNREQEVAFENYIRSGGGFVGIHGASTTEYEWEWFGKMIGAYFNGHPEPQEAVVIVNDTTHLSTKHLPKKWKRFDEWYNFRWVDEDFNMLLSLDESTYNGGGHKDNHPIAWYKPYDGGRMFYTALGHDKESYSEQHFLNHVLGGILYAIDNPAKE